MYQECSVEDRRIIDSVLRDYPHICLCLKQRKEYLIAITRADRTMEARSSQGGPPTTEQERVLIAMTSDVEYCELSAIAEVISDALGELSNTMLAIIKRLFFEDKTMAETCQELHCSEKWVRLRRRLSYDVLCVPVFRVYPLIRRWRSRERSRREAALRIVDKCS